MNVKHIEVGLNSNIGLRRKDNQDSACASHGVYVVCDGMGGGKGGKQASSDVAERFARLAELPTRDLDAIDETLILAQQEVLRLGEQLGGVAGTTISGVLLPTRVGDDAICSDERCYIVNVGDSRTYHMRADGNGAWLADSLTCITRDHSERQNAIDSGQMLPDEASRCIPRNIITQCVGAPAGIQPDWYAARADGRFIICSDGLHAQIGREQLAEIAAAYADPQMAAVPKTDVYIALPHGSTGTDYIIRKILFSSLQVIILQTDTTSLLQSRIRLGSPSRKNADRVQCTF